MGKREKKIYLQKIGRIDNKILENLNKVLNKRFKVLNLSSKIVEERMPLLNSEYNRMRKQYDGSKILTRLFNNSTNRQYFRTLGVLDVDTYSSGLNFVFGIATPPHNEPTKKYGVALISVTRLREEFYNHTRDEKLFKLRVLKEAVHELGHTLGLKHCDNYCVMRFSNYLGKTDQKPVEYCESCTKNIANFLHNINLES